MKLWSTSWRDSSEVCGCFAAVDPPTSTTTNSEHTWVSYKIPPLLFSCAFWTWNCCQTRWHQDTRTHTDVICAPVELLPFTKSCISQPIFSRSAAVRQWLGSNYAICCFECAFSVTSLTSLLVFLLFLVFSQGRWNITWRQRCSDTVCRSTSIFCNAGCCCSLLNGNHLGNSLEKNQD